jgi:hypothetical protein
VVPIVASTWNYGHQPYAFTFGPLAKVGFDTPLTSSLTGTSVAAVSHEFYTNYGFGTRLALEKMSYSTNVAPDTIAYFDVVSGRFSNFDVPNVLNRPWRFGFEGIMKVPNTPFILGFSANVHQNFGLGHSTTVDNAKDDLRFLFGAKFDAGKLLEKIPSLK